MLGKRKVGVPVDPLLGIAACQAQEVGVEDLDSALSKLSGLSARQARVVELRVFGGLTNEEVAKVLDVGVTTVKADWQFARAWLKRELSQAQ